MDLGIDGRVALVTGASKGIGKAIATTLAAEGARVALTSTSQERIEAAAAEVGGTGFVHDTADAGAAPALVERIDGGLGPVDILITNSGGPPGGADPLGFSTEQWQQAYAMLTLGPLALVEAVMPGMRERGWGRIVSVSSSSIREPIPGLVLSNAHRVALQAAFKTIAGEVARDGVTLNTLLTGRIATDRLKQMHGSLDAAEAAAREQVPAGRLGRPEEMAAAAAFLCSNGGELHHRRRSARRRRADPLALSEPPRPASGGLVLGALGILGFSFSLPFTRLATASSCSPAWRSRSGRGSSTPRGNRTPATSVKGWRANRYTMGAGDAGFYVPARTTFASGSPAAQRASWSPASAAARGVSGGRVAGDVRGDRERAGGAPERVVRRAAARGR